jgi:hypothetical protein
MDDRVRIFASILAAGGFFGALGCAFGALAGVLTWRSGRAAGTALGFAVARAFARAAQTELSPGAMGALVGGTDGFLFLGLVGTGFGAFAAYRGQGGWEVVSPAAQAALLLAGGAVFFGLLGYALVRTGVRHMAGVCAAGLCGAIAGALLGGADGLMLGTAAGVLAGTAAALLARR